MLLVLLAISAGSASAAPGDREPAERLSTEPLSPGSRSDVADAGITLPAGLARQAASPDVHYVAHWVATTSDNATLPYVIVDKVAARVYVFDAEGQLQGAAAALLGMVRGDGSAAGVGKRPLSSIGASERTTPAGRFVASLAPDLHGQDILWVDYDTALALHRVVKGTAAERRAERLESPTPEDNRISYGCINVPVAFYEAVVQPAFRTSSGVVYILPEKSSARDMFKPRVATP